jgi:hypothetical protein
MVDDAVAMIRWRVERVELQRNAAGIDDVVSCASWDEYREARLDRCPNAIEYRFAGPLLDAKELVELVDFRPDFLIRLQSHDDELAVLGRVEHAPKFTVLDSEVLDVAHKAFHGDSLSLT